jgi:diguanylate cyclase (GGDEF)-like protein
MPDTVGSPCRSAVRERKSFWRLPIFPAGPFVKLRSKGSFLSRTQITVAAATGVWLVHVGVTVVLGTRNPGPLLSDVIQLALGGWLIWTLNAAANRSQGMARAFWHLAIFAFALWESAQTLAVYNDLSVTLVSGWITNLIFSFWFAPLAMALFLDPEHEAGRLDAVMALDFLQGLLVCVAAYLYFFYLPQAASVLAHEVWAPYFVGYALVAAAFLLRAAVTRSRDVRRLFGPMGAFLACSGAVDALYYYGPGASLKTGQWFDLLWSLLLLVPIYIAAWWKPGEAPEITLDAPRREKAIYAELFYLLYPLLVLFMSVRIARERLEMAAAVVMLSFLCSSARLLVSQTRLIRAQEALRREASHDSLTGLWNHKVILEILERELLRAERDQHPVGVIMVDVDHFKAINDSRGHATGDAVLRIIANSIAAMVRPYDSVGRYGGEEFLIVVPGCGLVETAELAERVRAHVAGSKVTAGGANMRVSLSLGVAIGASAADLQKVLYASDSAMYQAKRAGRNRVEPEFIKAGLGQAAGAGEGKAYGADRHLGMK